MIKDHDEHLAKVRIYYQENKERERERARKYYYQHVEEVLQRTRKYGKEHPLPRNRKDPLHERAINAVSYAIKTGKLIRPNACEWCGKETLLNAHHWNGYEKENQLNVIFLCHSCHHTAHGRGQKARIMKEEILT